MTVNPPASTPLLPYRVLDLTDERGYLCGRMLADLGADVIKIEPPGGDPGRLKGPLDRRNPEEQKSLFWRTHNVNKRGITLDLTRAEGQELLTKLAGKADFLIESFDPGYQPRLGLGYDSLSHINPELIMVSITGFGQKGPYSGWKASDLVNQAMGGFMYTTGYKDGPPMRIGYPTSFLHASSEAAAAALTALYHRATTGQGQHVDVSAQQCVTRTLMQAVQTWDLNRRNLRRAGNEYDIPDPPIRYRHHWNCSDGQICYINWGGPFFVKHSPRLYRLINEKDGTNVGHLLDQGWLRGEHVVNQEEMDAEAEVLTDFFGRHTKGELYDWAVEEKITIAPVNDPQDILDSSQLKSREFWTQVEDGTSEEPVPHPGAFAMMSETPCQIYRIPPGIGEHNEEVFVDELGLSEAEMDRLKDLKIV